MSPRSVNPISLSIVDIIMCVMLKHYFKGIPVCLSNTRFSLMCISSISRITHLSFSEQNEILAVSASSMSTGAEKPVSCYSKPVT